MTTEVFPIGDQRVGIILDAAVLNGDDEPTFDELGAPVVTSSTVWVDRALFEEQTPTENTDMITTTGIKAFAILPVAADQTIPAIDDDDNPVSLPFITDGRVTVNANARLTHNGLSYQMRGDAVLEQDLRGRPNHVFCLCERTDH